MRSILSEHVRALSEEGKGRGGPQPMAALVVSGSTVGQCSECDRVDAHLRRMLRWAKTVICYRVGGYERWSKIYVFLQFFS